MSDPRFAELLDAYWSAAYAQGKEGRNHDDRKGSAQIAESNLCHYVESLRSELILAAAAFDAVNEKLSTAREEGRRAGLEEAARIAYVTCAKTRHVKLGDECAAAIRAKIEETKL